MSWFIIILLLVILEACAQVPINTFAGAEPSYSGENIRGTTSLVSPRAVTYDRENNILYFTNNFRIQMLNLTTGNVSTLAGNNMNAYNGEDIPAASAQFFYPSDVAVDNENKLIYIAELLNHRVRVLNQSSGLVSTFAGTTGSGYNGDNILAKNAMLNAPSSVGLDGDLVYIADRNNHRIRVVDRRTGYITTFAGSVSGFLDNVLATNASLYSPSTLSIDRINNLVYISDTYNNRIRMVNRTSGYISTIAGRTAATYGGDNGLAINAYLNRPYGVAVDMINNLVYIADSSNHRVRVVNRTSGIITTFAGTGSGGYNLDNTNAKSALINNPIGVTVDHINDCVYIADSGNYRLRSVRRSNLNINTVVGSGSIYYDGDGNLATLSHINQPHGVATDSINNLVYIADTYNRLIRVVDRSNGLLTTFAGNGQGAFNGDNIIATNANFGELTWLEVDSINNLVYIADAGFNRIRFVNRTSGRINTIAGTTTAGYNNDSILASSAKLNRPFSLAVDSINNLVYISDSGNHRVRVVDRSTGYITTVAGTGIAGYNGDDIPATSAHLNEPIGLALDSTKNLLYIADSSNLRIRILNLTSGNISSLLYGVGLPFGIALDVVNNVAFGLGNRYKHWLYDNHCWFWK
ncbi:NHL repeat-containing protein [Acrasis kona]|uniref:NHL repeat-containing protein n=1 Tax=Acrasis kona TaxID=1008807 RepID=A0AAW2Z543_9EUKA